MKHSFSVGWIPTQMPLADAWGRRVRYLRLSLAAACSMRCLYCRPTTSDYCDQEGMLTAIEIETLARHMVRRHGLQKIRLTGGEPRSRCDLLEIISRLARIVRLNDLAVTTNGLTLAASAYDYAAAGLSRVNISLDTLDRERFARMTGVDGLNRVVKGIDTALAVGLSPVKLNTVVIRGENEEELPALVDFAAARGIAIRFIELMPMGPLASQWDQRYVSADEIRWRLADVVADWQARPQGTQSAKQYAATLTDGRQVSIGFITPMSCHFCSACDRLRLTSDGAIYPCLMGAPSGSIMSALRPTFDADGLDMLLKQALAGKAAQHPAQGAVSMTQIGG